MFYLLFIVPLPCLAHGLTGGPVQGIFATRHAVFMASFAVLLISSVAAFFISFWQSVVVMTGKRVPFVRVACRSVCVCRFCLGEWFGIIAVRLYLVAIGGNLKELLCAVGSSCPLCVSLSGSPDRFKHPLRSYAFAVLMFDVAKIRRYFLFVKRFYKR